MDEALTAVRLRWIHTLSFCFRLHILLCWLIHGTHSHSHTHTHADANARAPQVKVWSCTDVLSIPAAFRRALRTCRSNREKTGLHFIFITPQLPRDTSVCICLSLLFISPPSSSGVSPPLSYWSIPKVGQSLRARYLTEEMGSRCVRHHRGNKMHTRTHRQTNRRLSCSVACAVDESLGLTSRLLHVSVFLLSSHLGLK